MRYEETRQKDIDERIDEMNADDRELFELLHSELYGDDQRMFWDSKTRQWKMKSTGVRDIRQRL